MTENEAKDWITKVNGNLSVTSSIGNAQNFVQAVANAQLAFCELRVGADAVRAVFDTSPRRDLLFPFMVLHFISKFGDPSVP